MSSPPAYPFQALSLVWPFYFSGLLARGNTPPRLSELANGLLSNLSLLFVPASVGVLLHAELLGTELLPIAASLALSTLITLVVTGWIMQSLSSIGEEN